ncbi:hypothetical protein LTR85_003021 [Meristemomyces frigidus]|nr:hypothetical protein LTR85_003021 [Meristemomyces frigidus]
MTGTLCFTTAIPPKHYTPAQSLIDKLQSFRQSERITQYFCPVCGTHMLGRVLEDGGKPDGPGYWDLMTGTLDQAEGVFDVSAHIFIEDTLDGGFSDFVGAIADKEIERWPQGLHQGKQLPQYWHSLTIPNVEPSQSDKLHAHCKCGGVNFYIARPTARSALGTAGWPDVLIPFNSEVPLPPDEAWWIRDGGKKFLGGFCACNSCRLAAGMEWVEWAFVPTVDISLDAEGDIPLSLGSGTLKPYRSSKRATRYFCGTCGASVFWNGDERPQVIDVAVGLLDAAEGSRAESWLDWRTQRLSFREDAIPRGKSLTHAVEIGLAEHEKRAHGSLK